MLDLIFGAHARTKSIFHVWCRMAGLRYGFVKAWQVWRTGCAPKDMSRSVSTYFKNARMPNLIVLFLTDDNG